MTTGPADSDASFATPSAAGGGSAAASVSASGTGKRGRPGAKKQPDPTAATDTDSRDSDDEADTSAPASGEVEMPDRDESSGDGSADEGAADNGSAVAGEVEEAPVNLFVAHQQGDPDALDRLIRRYSGPVYNFIYRMVGSSADAEDLTQQTWVRVLRSIDRYEPRAKELTFLLQIARNLCLDHFKKMSLRQHQPLHHGSTDADGEGGGLADILSDSRVAAPIDPVLATEDAERLHAAIATLSDKKRESLVLRFFDELPYDQIAEIVGSPAGTIKYRVHEAVQDLRALLANPPNEDSSSALNE